MLLQTASRKKASKDKTCTVQQRIHYYTTNRKDLNQPRGIRRRRKRAGRRNTNKKCATARNRRMVGCDRFEVHNRIKCRCTQTARGLRQEQNANGSMDKDEVKDWTKRSKQQRYDDLEDRNRCLSYITGIKSRCTQKTRVLKARIKCK